MPTQRKSRLGGAQLGLLLAAGIGVIAPAATAHAADAPARKPSARAPARTASARDGEIEALKAQVQALTARLDAQEAAQRRTAQTAQAAQTQATAAAAQSQAAETQVAAQAKAVPEQVKTALAEQPAAKSGKPNWYDNTQISGRSYINLSRVERKADGDKIESDSGLLIKRFYLGIDHTFNEVYAANLTTDVDNVVGNNNDNLVGKGLYIKKAYLQATIDPALKLRFGSADLPWIPFVDGVSGYRYVENSLIDRTKFGTSADWGVHALGEVADGLFSYQVSAVDGGGYRDAKLTKTIDFEGRASVKYLGVQAALGGYTGKLGKHTDGSATFHTANRVNALLAYKAERYSFGGEYFHATNWNQVTAQPEDKSDGYSMFASANLLPKVAVFGRYDWVKPKKDLTPGLRDRYYYVGVQYSPAKIVDFALVYKRDRAEGGRVSTSNGTIGGTDNGTYNEIGVFGNFQF